MTKIVSIHIPKTAGTSFYQVLNQVFGEDNCIRLKRNELHCLADALTTKHVIHGHFTYQEVKPFLNKEDFLIVWFRNPIDRVISNYNFFVQRAQSGKFPDLKKRAEENIIEYAALEESRNRMSKFIDGIDLSLFNFIGLLENSEQDFTSFGKLFNKVITLFPQENAIANKNQADEKIRNQIASFNEDDVTLYRKVCTLKNVPFHI